MAPADPAAALGGGSSGIGNYAARPYGRDHVLVDLDGPDAVTLALTRLRQQEPRLEVRPGWSSLLVAASDAGALLHQLAAVPAEAPGDADPPREARPADEGVGTHLIDVRYDGEDLAGVAGLVGLTLDEVIHLHCAAEYRVVFLGFTRGFPYLRGLDPRLAAVPRLDRPRVRVPAGSVGIAAGQTGIYPMDSPGGWQLLGRTGTSVFDTARTPPARLAPGDVVRFRAV